MIITRTPFRISFFGGGTDYANWYANHGGKILSSTINKYCYINIRYLPPFFDKRSRIVWSQIETVNFPHEIQHPVVRAGLEYLGIEAGVEVHHDGDLPARSGLGSSSAFTVGFLSALYALRGKMVGKEKLAKEAIYLERDYLKEAVGIQDQIAVAHGGLNQISINKDGTFQVQPIIISTERRALLEQHLMLFFSGISRYSSDLAAAQMQAVSSNESVLRRMMEIADMGIDVLTSTDSIDHFGNLLHESWQLKKSLCSLISNDITDHIYDSARKFGAYGGKVLGAGGGGFMLIFAKPENQSAIREALKDFLEVPFNFENSGTQIIFYDNDIVPVK
jgi:D-glycero-alpha-D-manno-heptose-7-phosphate kinase